MSISKTAKNDKIILALQKKVEEKRAAVKKAVRFAPITNCSIELHNKRYNIHVLQKDELVSMLVILNAYKNSAIELEYLDDFVISGVPVTNWITDLKAKLMHITIKEEESKLKALEDKLQKLLSNEKKVELELQGIEDSLKNL